MAVASGQASTLTFTWRLSGANREAICSYAATSSGTPITPKVSVWGGSWEGRALGELLDGALGLLGDDCADEDPPPPHAASPAAATVSASTAATRERRAGLDLDVLTAARTAEP